MDSMNTWLDDQIDDPEPDESFSLRDNPSPLNRHALGEALNKLTIAVAALQRAGAYYGRKSEAFWLFAAGSWHRQVYDGQVCEAGKKLPKRTSVEHDVAFAEDKVVEAIALLRREGDVRDAGDLTEALEVYRNGSGW